MVVADEQDEGRGRRGRTWVSSPGGLYASLLVPSDPLLSLRAGIAVATALAAFGIEARLKWPNDVLVGERKIAGILIETVGDRAIVGIGVNRAPVSVAGATSLAEEASLPCNRDDLLGKILEGFSWDSPRRILSRYRALSATIGRIVRVEVGTGAQGRIVTGRAEGVDPVGRLLVREGATLEAIVCGDCVHLATR